MKHEIMSVPPLMEASCTSRFTASYTHSKPSSGSGEPVEQTARKRLRSNASPGWIAAF